MNKFEKFSILLAATATLLVATPSTANCFPLDGSAIKRVTHVINTARSKFKKKKKVTSTDSEVMIEVDPKMNYSVILHRGQRLALVLDANDGRIWNIEKRADEIVDERPEGKASVTFTTIFFTPKEVDGQGYIVLQTKLSENYPEDWTNADTCVIHITVHNKK